MRIVVAGAGPAGMAAALVLARDGVDVVLLEPDPSPPAFSEDAMTAWARPGAPHCRQAHQFMPLARSILARALPDVYADVLADGALENDMRDGLPAGAADEGLERDLVSLRCRRFVLERALRRAVERQPGVDLRPRRALDVVGHVVRTDREPLTADVVVDAAGRRSPLADALAARREEIALRSEDCGVSYLTRYYRRRRGTDVPTPLTLGLGLRVELPHTSAALLPADDGVFSVTFGVSPDDRELRRVLADAPAFDAAAAVTPSVRRWIRPEVAVPLSDVLVMGGLSNRLLVQDDLSVPYVAIGDAACTTNPQLGWGVSLALRHVALLRAALVAPEAAAAARQAVFADCAPRWCASLDEDQQRLRWWRGHGWEPTGLHCLAWAAREDRAAAVALARRTGALDLPNRHLEHPGLRSALDRAHTALRTLGPLQNPTRADHIAAATGRSALSPASHAQHAPARTSLPADDAPVRSADTRLSTRASHVRHEGNDHGNSYDLACPTEQRAPVDASR